MYVFMHVVYMICTSMCIRMYVNYCIETYTGRVSVFLLNFICAIYILRGCGSEEVFLCIHTYVFILLSGGKLCKLYNKSWNFFPQKLYDPYSYKTLSCKNLSYKFGKYYAALK